MWLTTLSQAENMHRIRKMAFLDLDGALLKILEDTLSYLEISGGDIDPMTEETRKYYSKKKQ